MTQQGLKEAIAEIAELPLEQRYLWRILPGIEMGIRRLR
jgi:hypothetical protein